MEQIETLKNELQETKKTNQDLTAEKQNILNLLTETQKMNKTAQSKYEQLEEQVRNTFICNITSSKHAFKKFKLNDVMENKRICPTKIKISSTPSRDIELETETWEFDQQHYEVRFYYKNIIWYYFFNPLQERLVLLKAELAQSHNTIVSLQAEISSLQQQVTALEFQK